ncbi:MAG TPA: hypothetical protein VJV39_27390 [Dongiaceae bacterium]|nr:hypothetical protein [Dongiaceae bacterium]
MRTRRELLLGLVAGAAGFGLLTSRAFAWYVDELTPDQAAALAAGTCRVTAGSAPEDHAALIAAVRQTLLRRIASGALPSGSSEQVGCPLCGCRFTVTAGGTR